MKKILWKTKSVAHGKHLLFPNLLLLAPIFPEEKPAKEIKCYFGSRRYKREQLLLKVLGRRVGTLVVDFKGLLHFYLRL